MVAIGPKTWNATITAVDGDAVTVDFRAKWVNYHYDNGVWLPMSASFNPSSNGSFEHTASTWSIEAPAQATGRIRLYADNDYDPHARLYRTLTSVPALELDHPDARPVDAVYDPTRPHEVTYPDALGDGCDLLLRMWHARGMRAEHLIRIRTMPTEGHNAIITERIYTPLRIPGWTGTPTEIGGSGAAMVVVGDPTLGMRMRPAFAWYYDQAGDLITTPISVVVERRVGAGYVMLTKTIPASFIAAALAAGAYVLADETTSNFFPDATETTCMDGTLINAGNTTWATLHDATSASSVDLNASSNRAGRIESTSTSNQWAEIDRSMFLFDTSSLTSDATVTSATLSLYGATDTGDLTVFANQTLGVVSSSPAANTSLAVGDFDNFGTTDFATRLTTWSTSAYNVFTLNASGLADIATTGITKYGTRVGPDIDNSPPTWQSERKMSRTCFFAERTGTTNDPKLAVTYTLPTFGGCPFGTRGYAFSGGRTFHGIIR